MIDFAAIRFEELGKGRRGAVLVKPDARGVPIVRTTTAYHAPAQVSELPGGFNNALVEHYTSAYRTMKQHSDQALDLVGGVEIHSYYRDPSRPSRRLLRTDKTTGATSELLLDHASVVAFSLDENRRSTHAILPAGPDNDWFGITLRTSKTFVKDGAIAGVPLTLADDDQRREFLQLRRRENAELDFTWPAITYTISASDLLPPI